MKKILFAAMAICVGMTSCMNEDFPYAPNYGYINVNVTNDPVVVTRATVVEADELVNWTVVVSQESGEKFTGKANTLASKSFVEGAYNVRAYNYVDDATANAINDEWGDARYEGNTAVQVEKGKTTTANVECGVAKNIRVGVVFDDSFTGAVAEGYQLVTSVGETRSHTFNSTTTDKKAYYSVNQEITYTLTYMFQGTSKTVEGAIAAVENGGVEHSLNVKLNTNGSINIAITVGDFTTSDKDITIDGGSGEEVVENNDSGSNEDENGQE